MSRPFLFTALFALVPLSFAAKGPPDPCAAIAGQAFVQPADALACLKSFPFNETLRQNVLTHNIARVFDFYTFEDYYLDSPPPFQESTANIRAGLAKINTTKYKVSICVLFLYCRVLTEKYSRQVIFNQIPLRSTSNSLRLRF